MTRFQFTYIPNRPSFTTTLLPSFAPSSARTPWPSLDALLTIPSVTTLSAVSWSTVRTSPSPFWRLTKVLLYFKYGPYGPMLATMCRSWKVPTVLGRPTYPTASSRVIPSVSCPLERSRLRPPVPPMSRGRE